MKKITTIFLLVLSFNSYGQKDTVYSINDSTVVFVKSSIVDTLTMIGHYSRFSFYGDSTGSIYINESTKEVDIQGDTIHAILAMNKAVADQIAIGTENFKYAYGQYEKEERLHLAALAVLNQVPDYYRTAEGNCAWPKYWSLLKKEGYKITKRKTPSKNCE